MKNLKHFVNSLLSDIMGLVSRITKKTSKIRGSNLGLIVEEKYYLFGLCVSTENSFYFNKIERDKMDLEEITGYEKWRADMKLMRLSDEQFDNLI